jgi:hypothetical protein
VGTIPPVSDRVIIRIPGATPHPGLIRAAASALAALQDFTYDRITDLHIAIDEVCGRILAASLPSLTRLEVAFEVTPEGIEVQANGDAELKPGAEFLSPWSKAILTSTTSDLEVSSPDRSVRARFRVAKG